MIQLIRKQSWIGGANSVQKQLVLIKVLNQVAWIAIFNI